MGAAKRRSVVWLGATLLVVGCEFRPGPDPLEDPAPGAGSVDTVAAQPGEPAVRPAEKRVTVSIEGEAEEMRFVLYEAPTDFPLRFSTYLPADMAAERWPTNEGDAVAFVAMFGGQRNEAAAIRVIAHREGAAMPEVLEILDVLARDLGAELVESSDAPVFDWSVREFRTVPDPSHDGLQGTMALGRRGDRYFTVATHYPAEYADGFGPRAHHVLQEWRWGSGPP